MALIFGGVAWWPINDFYGQVNGSSLMLGAL
jgi:hypothetical protein